MPELQMMTFPQTPRAIHAHFIQQERLVADIRALMNSFMRLDARPLQIVGETVERIGPDPVPAVLREMYATEYAKLKALEQDFIAARDAEGR